MTRHRRAGLGRIALAFGVIGLLAACDSGPDRVKVADELKSGVEAQLKLLEGSAEAKMLSHTAVTVTEEDEGAYLVSIEGLKFHPAADSYLDIGTVSYLATPKDEKTHEVSGLKIAPTMPFKGLDGKERGKLTVTTKAFNGLWSKELGTFQKVSGEFADIAATDDTGGDVRLSGASFQGDLVDKGGGLFDATAWMVLTGFVAKDSDGGAFTVGETRFDGLYDSVKLQEYTAAATKYQELTMKQLSALEAPAGQQGGTATPPPALTPEEQKAMSDAVSALAAAIKGGAFKFALRDLKYSDASGTPFTLGGLTLDNSIDGVNQEKAILGFGIAHQDLALTSADMAGAIDQAALPRSGSFGLKVTNIPSQDMVKVLADNLPGMMSADAAMAEANAMAMVVALQAVFQTSGARIEVVPSQLKSQLVDLTADGAFDVVPQSMFGVVGGLDVAIRGIDDLLALAQQTPDQPDAQQMMGAVGMLQMYAQREQGADGKPVDKFKIEIDSSGQILINGKPM